MLLAQPEVGSLQPTPQPSPLPGEPTTLKTHCSICSASVLLLPPSRRMAPALGSGCPLASIAQSWLPELSVSTCEFPLLVYLRISYPWHPGYLSPANPLLQEYPEGCSAPSWPLPTRCCSISPFVTTKNIFRQCQASLEGRKGGKEKTTTH